ncbi:intercellular adhesion molecule 2 isoform X1 [Balaenoptera acutorostrata]|uniref:Intercellular adhesion molecule 2 isoform X1 n=2 Tax=Balaenoptera acutorostrata TaxID=9767 RepID=A0A383ZL23_BALAC|nr:intercellular adhesion molecule 2 isoform X1 [Balaenoptera acutorostrata]
MVTVLGRHLMRCRLNATREGSSRLFPASPWTPLEMSPFGGWGLLSAFLALLCCTGSGEEAFEVRMWPEQLMVESGESQVINCSTTCTQPNAGGLETTLHKTLLEEQAQWKLYEVFNISQDTDVICHFTCSGKQESRSLNVSVFYPPKQVLLKLWPTLVAVGKSFTIQCRVPSVAPLEGLTVTLLRGSEIVYNQTFVGTTLSPQEAMVTHNTTAHREDDRHNFSCRAEMDLRSRGGDLVHSVSDPQALDVYEPAQDSQTVIIITVVSVLLFLFVTSVLLCFVFGQQWHQRRTGTYGVQAAWRRLRWAYRA